MHSIPFFPEPVPQGHLHISLHMSNVCSDVILSVPIAFVVPFLLLNPYVTCQSMSLIFISVLNILTAICATCALRLIVSWLLHFLAYGFLFKAVIVTLVKYLGHSPVSCMLFSCALSLRPSPNNFNTYPGTS